MDSTQKPSLQRDDPPVMALLFAQECRTVGDVIYRLEYVLDHHGGSLDEDDEPGLTPETQRIERALRQAIRFLRALSVFVLCSEFMGAAMTCHFSLRTLAISL